ncbi:MAG: RsmD family RNA methyltransferase [Coriobacteriales bacterium]|nr:RsmD family RNA methyltransferase [Coriobacteriales bacterium]
MTRPTTDRMRESMFSSISSRVDFEGAVCFDAFAGSGALGIEALSRGAAFCMFAENNASARRVLLSNLKAVALPQDVFAIYPKNVLRSIEYLKENKLPKFNLVMLDPPYKYEARVICEFLRDLISAQAFAQNCLVTYEIDAKNAQDAKMCLNKLNELLLVHEKNMADSTILFLQYKE